MMQFICSFPKRKQLSFTQLKIKMMLLFLLTIYAVTGTKLDDEVVSPFQKNRWFQCWVLKSVIINHQHFSVEIVKLILAYAKFAPVTTSLSFHEGGLYTGVFSRDGRWLLSLEFNSLGNLYLSDTSTGQIVRTFKTQDKFDWDIYTCAIADSRLFIICSAKYNIYLWNTNSVKLVTTLTGHTGIIRSCCIFSNDTRIASASVDQTVRVWQIEPPIYSCLYVLPGHISSIQSCVVSADNAWIISLSNDRLCVWNTDTAESHQILTDHTTSPSGINNKSCVMSLDNRYIVSIVYGGLTGGEAKRWDFTTGECITTIPRISEVWSGSSSYHIAYLSSERLVWANLFLVGVWEFKTSKNIYILPFEGLGDVKIVNVSAEGKYLIIVLNKAKLLNSAYSFRPLIRVYRFETGEFMENEGKKEE